MNDRTKFAAIVAVVVLLLFFGFIALVFSSPFGSDGLSDIGGVSLAIWILIILAAFFIIAIILALIISAITWGQWLGDFREGSDRKGGAIDLNASRIADGQAALQILDQRYARGEITRDEYVRMKDDIDRTRRASGKRL